MKLDILKIRITAVNIISLASFAICSILLLFRILLPGIWHLIYVVVYSLSMVGIIVLPIIFLNYVVIGYLVIENSKIKIVFNKQNEKEYPFNQIKQLRFEFNETASDGGYGIRFGINNNICITDLNNTVFKYKIKINNPQVVRFIDAKLDSLKDQFEIIKLRKGKKVNNLIIK